MKQNTKEWMQHTSAIMLIVSAIVMGFLSFLTTEEIGAGPLTYIGEVLSAALALFGVANYFSNQMTQFKSEVRNELQRMAQGQEEGKEENG